MHDLGAALGQLSEYIEQGYFEQPSEGEVWGPNEAEDWSFEELETATAFPDRARKHQREVNQLEVKTFDQSVGLTNQVAFTVNVP